METLTIFIIVIIVTIILFSSFNVSYSSDTPIANTNKSSSKVNIKPESKNNVTGIDIGKYNPNASSYALYNLPEKDQYMTPDLKNQIDALRTQYYYDNCAKPSFQQ